MSSAESETIVKITSPSVQPDSMRRRLVLSPLVLALLLAVVLVLTVSIATSLFWQRQVILISLTAMVVLGLNLSYGFAGELSLGQAAMYAAGAYTTGILATHHYNDLALTLPASALAAALIGLLSGMPGLRLGGWALAMVSFFLVLLLPDVINLDPTLTGGFAGIAGIPDAGLFGIPLGSTGYFVMVLTVTALVFAAIRNLVVSRHGAAFRVLRQSPILAASLGISVYRTKLVVYVAGAVPAGIAGGLFAYLDGFIAPDSFGFSTSVAFLAASILGGSQSVYGALVGASLLQLGPLRSTAFQHFSLVIYGLFLIVGGILFSGGVAGIAGNLVRRWLSIGPSRTASPTLAIAEPVADVGTFPGRTLRVSGVSKQFGGVVALENVTLRAEPGQITAIIGANGSGKTTLLNLISGFYRLDGGRISLGTAELVGCPPHQVARRGVGRTFQTPLIPSRLTASEVVATARYVRPTTTLLSSILRLPSFRHVRAEDRAEATRWLQMVGIAALADQEASLLSLGTRRLLEVARAVAARPALLLLDEPASGLDEHEIVAFANAIRRIRTGGATVVLVEHNFPLVLQLADRIHVLQRGRLLASGTPSEIRNNTLVAESYLGRRSEAT
ncbi:MAG TPA: branched-chain amino acid ABC transporter ATP-binding protein/permease [Chloroflexota bacterium]|nr:branched-chain amino acid ABC transporter ATP-binding protein/permease [Chloroflexota bacterium]